MRGGYWQEALHSRLVSLRECGFGAWVRTERGDNTHRGIMDTLGVTFSGSRTGRQRKDGRTTLCCGGEGTCLSQEHFGSNIASIFLAWQASDPPPSLGISFSSFSKAEKISALRRLTSHTDCRNGIIKYPHGAASSQTQNSGHCHCHQQSSAQRNPEVISPLLTAPAHPEHQTRSYTTSPFTRVDGMPLSSETSPT